MFASVKVNALIGCFRCQADSHFSGSFTTHFSLRKFLGGCPKFR